MKGKPKTLMQKTNGVLIPVYPEHLAEITEQIKEGDTIQVQFSNPSRRKTSAQMGYLFAGAYPFLFRELTKLGWDTVYLPNVGEVKMTDESLDLYFKDMFSMFIQKEFTKADADKEQLSEYIDFLDKYSIQNIGHHLPDPPKKEKT